MLWCVKVLVTCLNQDFQDNQDLTRIRKEMNRKMLIFLPEPGFSGFDQDKKRDEPQNERWIVSTETSHIPNYKKGCS